MGFKVGCAGAVLIHVRRKQKIQNPFDDSDNPSDGVSRIKLWTMENSMQVSSTYPMPMEGIADILSIIGLLTRTP